MSGMLIGVFKFFTVFLFYFTKVLFKFLSFLNFLEREIGLANRITHWTFELYRLSFKVDREVLFKDFVAF